ncbi:hypothetical protein ACRPFF_11405, partial [Neisseria sp. SLRRB23]|uniref:hypothetical protein n=1 Tax=Neisseria sp. SLRRB23 TaxID=3435199 RepID=UPI003D7F5742
MFWAILDPDLDLWKTAKPFLVKWMNGQVGPKALWRNLKNEAPDWAQIIRSGLDLEMMRPEGLAANIGLKEQGYYLSEICLLYTSPSPRDSTS